MHARILCGQHHALYAARAKAARHQHALHACQRGVHIGRAQRLGVHPAYLHLPAAGIAAVVQRLHHREVGVVQLYIFAHHSNGYLAFGRGDARAHGAPFGKVRPGGGAQPQAAAHKAVQPGLVQHQRHVVQAFQRAVFNHALRRHVAKGGQLLQNAVLQRLVTAGDDNVRHNAHALQLVH